MIFYFLLIALALQRLSEVAIGNRNLALIRSKLVAPLDEAERRQMFALHLAWFLSAAGEFYAVGQIVSELWFAAGAATLLLCQIVRFLSMRELGDSWIHLPIAYRGQRIVRSGLYRYVRHPNYLIVAVEIAVVPLLGGAFVTALIFSVLNAAFLFRRIQIENQMLKKVSKS